MFNMSDLDQVGVLLWDKHKKNEHHILPRPRKIEGNILPTFGECSKKQIDENTNNTTRSMVETSGAKHDFLNSNAEKVSANSSQDCNDSRLHMDAWSDLPYLSSVFNDGSDEDSAVTELMNDLANASNLYSGVGIMTRYNNSSELLPNKGLSSLSKPCSLLTGDAMQLDGEPELFGHDDKVNYSFLDYDWANIEDLDDLDKIFRNNDSFDGNEKVHNANAFHNTSSDITSNTSQFIPGPGMPTSTEQTSDTGSPYHQLCEHFDAKMNSLLAKKADGQGQTWRAQEEEKRKGTSFQGLNYSCSSEKQPMSSVEVQGSNVNPLHVIQSPPLGQVSCSHGVMFSDYGYPTPLPQVCVESNQHKPIHAGFKANLDCPNNRKISKKAAAVPKATIMTPQEKIEKLKRRQKMQAMLAIQKKGEQYGHQIYSTDDSVSQECSSKNQAQDATTSTDTMIMGEYKRKQSTPEVSYLEEQYQSQVMSSSINGRSVEVAIYHQLQYTMQKLDVRVRLNIRDSLFRLARSAMERLNASDRSCTDKNKDEYEIFMDEQLNNHDRSSSMPDLERVTNPIDRIVAHLLFHNSSQSYSLPIGDGNMPMAISM